MSRAGDLLENPATWERAVVRVGTEETGGGLAVAAIQSAPTPIGRAPSRTVATTLATVPVRREEFLREGGRR